MASKASRQRGKTSKSQRSSTSSIDAPTVAQRSIISQLFVIFKATPVIDKRDFYEEYSKFFKGKSRNDYLQDYEFTGVSNMLKTLDIFEYYGKAKLKFSLCREKLLNLLLNPEAYAHLPSDEKARIFLLRNGFVSKELCDYFNVSCLEDLLLDSVPSSPGIVHPSVSHPSSVPQPLLPQLSLPSSLPHQYPPLLRPPNPSLLPPSNPSLLPPSNPSLLRPSNPSLLPPLNPSLLPPNSSPLCPPNLSPLRPPNPSSLPPPNPLLPPPNPSLLPPSNPSPLPRPNPSPFSPLYSSSSAPFLPYHSPSGSYHSVPPHMVYTNNPLLPAASNPSARQAQSANKRPAMYESDRTAGDDDSSPPAPKKGSINITDNNQSSTRDDVKSVDNIQGKNPVVFAEMAQTGPMDCDPLSTGPPHFPDSSVHPRDVHHPPSFVHKDHQIPVLDRLPPPPEFKRGENVKDVVRKINSYAEMFTGIISSRGKHVPLSVVEDELKLLLGKAKRHGYYINLRDIDFWVNWEKLHKRTIEFIKVFCWHSPITTLYELQRILNESENVSDFKELKMGPLLKHPDIIRLFKVPEDLETVPEITAYDVHSKLFRFLDKSKNKKSKTQLEDFLDFLSHTFSIESPLHICIRITSYPLALQINFKFRRSQREIKERIESELEKSVSGEIEFELKNWKKKLSRMSSEIPKELERKDPIQLLNSFFEASLQYFPRHLQSRLTGFFQFLRDHPGLRDLFLLAMYQGVYGIQKKVHEEETASSPVAPFASSHSSVMSQVMTIPDNYRSQSEIYNHLLQMLKSLQFPIDLSSLVETEKSLIVKLGASSFESFGHGTFLEFLTNHKMLLKFLGGSTIGSSSSEGRMSTGGQRKREEVLECIRQLKDLSNQEKVSLVVMKQFNVRSVSQLACGDIEKLISDAQISPTTSSCSVRYLSALLSNSEYTTDASTSLSMTSQDALQYLKSAPLLADLACWSNWKLVFEPSCGSLSHFLSSHPDVHTLCVDDGVFLKIDPNSSVKDFANALYVSPSLSSGHLVSMVVRSGSTNSIPAQLLAQHVQTRLSGLLSDTIPPEKFVFECLVCMPVELAVTVGKEVFLDPLKKLHGSSKVDSLLLKATDDNPLSRSFLHTLGLKLGIKVWIDDYLARGKQPNTIPVTEPDLPVLKPVNPDLNKMDFSEESVAESFLESSFNNQSSNPSTSLNEPEESNTISTDVLPLSLASPFSVEEERDNALKIVENIRSEEFGIGLEFDEKTKSVMSKGKGRLDRSLQRLSEELYSKDTHFVLELVQNADDNSYPVLTCGSTSSFVPSLKFTLSKSCIVVLNNELGFSEKNIRAICDVGRSTKDRNASGYIGQKGIGFKSVFRVTKTPEIHSRGYHIRFDSSVPIGYILPEWVESSISDDIIDPGELAKWTTKIVLPFKSDSTNAGSSDMMSRFHDIQPSLLLFLNRLRCIIIEDLESKVIRSMKRHDRSNGIIEIRHNDGVDKWLLVRKTLHEANKYKPDVSATELALAFPLQDDLHNFNYDLSPQQVFAFLPLRSYGFKFIVQGDFDLPSSREDVNANSAWNQWLREEIPSLFMKSIDCFESHLTAIEAIIHILKFIPLEGEVHDFFQPVTSEILRIFKERKCLPTEPFPVHSSSPTDSPFDAMREITSIISEIRSLKGSSAGIQWKQPSQLLLIKEQSIQDCIPQSLLTASLKLYYLNSALNNHLSSQICSQLNIGSINIDHLMSVAQYVLSSYHQHKEEQFMSLQSSASSAEDESDEEEVAVHPVKCLNQWIALWLSCVHLLCEGVGGSTDEMSVLRKLKSFPVIPLSNGNIVSIDSGPIFFPPVSSKDVDISYRPVYDELRTVHTDLIDSDEKLVAVKANDLLLRLGVRNLNITEVIEQHIIPHFKKENTEDTSEHLLILYLSFIENAIERNQFSQKKAIDELKGHVVLITENGKRLKPSDEVIHFHSKYEPQCDLTKSFPNVKWVVVSPKYLNFGNKKNWKKFLTSLGVEEGIAVEKINKKIHSIEIKSKWIISNLKNSPDGYYTIHDYFSKDFELIFSSIQSLSSSKQVKQMKILLQLLNSSWNALYSKCVTALYYDGSNTHELGTAGSSTFGHLLSSKAWLPAVNIDGEPYSTCLLQGSQLYSMTDDLKNLLHDNVPYIVVDGIHISLLKHLCVQTEISCVELYRLLCKWSESSTFSSSIDHMRQVYIHLSDLTHNRVDFNEKPLIFVPSINQWRGDSSECVSGTFVTAKKACWTDKTEVLYNMLAKRKCYPDHLPQILSFFYNSKDDESLKWKIKNAFFILQVVKDMSIEAMIELLEFNASLTHIPSEDHIKSFYSIIEAIFNAAESEGDFEVNRQYVSAKVRPLPVFPSKKWVSFDSLFVDDNHDISKHFLQDEQVHFLSDAGMKSNQIKRVIKLFQIPLVSKNISTDLNPAAIRPYNDLKVRFHYIMPLLQLYLFNKFKGENIPLNHFEAVTQTLSDLTIFSTLELNCTYCLHKIHYANAQLKQCMLDMKPETPPVIYVVVNDNSKIVEMMSLVNVILSLALPKGLMSDLSQSLSLIIQELLLEDPRSKESQESFISKYSLTSLPPDVPRWDVELPKSTAFVTETKVEEKSPPVTEVEVEVEVKPVYGAHAQNSSSSGDSSGLKAWPPKAPSFLDVEYTEKMKLEAQQSASHLGSSRQVTKRDVITSDDIQRMKGEGNMHKRLRQEDGHDNVDEERKSLSLHDESHALSDTDYQRRYQTAQTGSHTGPHSGSQSTSAALNIESRSEYKSTANSQTNRTNNVTTSSNELQTGGTPPKKQKVSSEVEQQMHHQHDQELIPLPYQSTNAFHSFNMASMLEPLEITISKHNNMNMLINTKGEEDNFAIGRWGEEYVYKFLSSTESVPVMGSVGTIKWVNEKEESLLPYDIKFFRESDGQEFYIEVKSTIFGADREGGNTIALSWNEISFAKEKEKNYLLFVLFGAGNWEEVKVKLLRNLYGVLQDNPYVKLYIKI